MSSTRYRTFPFSLSFCVFVCSVHAKECDGHTQAYPRGSTLMQQMHPLTRNLYRRIITVGKDYPAGLEAVRNRAKTEFAKNAHLDSDGLEFRRAIQYGRYLVKEMIGVIHLKKYRTLRQRYEDDKSMR